MPEQALTSRIAHEALAARRSDRKHLVANAAALHGLSRSAICRGLHERPRPKPLHRADHGRPKVAAAADLERWCETIAAMHAVT